MLDAGDGVYISLYTGLNGFGKKISIEGMKTFWSKYGIGKEYIELLNWFNIV